MKVEQLVASVKRLQMVKNRSKLKASIYKETKEIKFLWRDLSFEANELLEVYNNTDIKDTELINNIYDKEWQLYAKMKVLNDKYNLGIDSIEERFKTIDTLKMSSYLGMDDYAKKTRKED